MIRNTCVAPSRRRGEKGEGERGERMRTVLFSTASALLGNFVPSSSFPLRKNQGARETPVPIKNS